MKCKGYRVTSPVLLWLSIAVVAIILSGCSQDNGKKVIGETARISLNDGGIEYLARVDTGARITSVHALDIEVAGGASDQKDNIGKMVTFSTENEKGERKQVTTEIIRVAKVRNAQGVEYRYVVDLNLNWQGLDKSGHVNLRDRSVMSYKLLIGRNWLSDDFVVDVNKSEGIIKGIIK
jgi:hypothetical protein